VSAGKKNSTKNYTKEGGIPDILKKFSGKENKRRKTRKIGEKVLNVFS